MTITWKEREHSVVDNEVMNDPLSLDPLRGCGLLKILKMPNMKTNSRLLEMLVNY